jgi:tRNA G18 (ribose-2'-O)-methylase SpoU
MPRTGPQIIPISNPSDPRLADYANLKDRQLAAMADLSRPDPSGTFMAEGELVVRQLALSGLVIRSLIMTPTRLETMGDLVASLPDHIPVYLLPLEAMSTIVGFHIHRGVLAAGQRPPDRDPRQLARDARTALVLEDLANHDNVGGVFRTAAALCGLDRTAIFLSPRCCDPLYRKAIRVSMGTALRVPFARLSPWPDSLGILREAGFTIVALTPDEKATPIHALPPCPRPALLVGAEGPGLSEETLRQADLHARIPMAPGVDSLNVVVAAGIALDRLRG